MATEKLIKDCWIGDIANPGYGPIFAVFARTTVREYMFTDNRVLTNNEDHARAFARKVSAKGSIEADLWDITSMTDDEREAQAYGYVEWEATERLAGRG